MASSKDYLEFILGQLCELNDISYRAMMGEFILYYKGKIVGGIYDDRLLVKPVKAAISYMPNAEYELPYDGANIFKIIESNNRTEKSKFALSSICTYRNFLCYRTSCYCNAK